MGGSDPKCICQIPTQEKKGKIDNEKGAERVVTRDRHVPTIRFQENRLHLTIPVRSEIFRHEALYQTALGRESGCQGCVLWKWKWLGDIATVPSSRTTTLAKESREAENRIKSEQSAVARSWKQTMPWGSDGCKMRDRVVKKSARKKKESCGRGGEQK